MVPTVREGAEKKTPETKEKLNLPTSTRLRHLTEPRFHEVKGAGSDKERIPAPHENADVEVDP